MLLKKKNAVIYGVGGAIGGAVARAFAREGATLFLTGRSRPPLYALAKETAAAGGDVEPAVVDAFDADATEKHAAAMVERVGRIDISFNLIAVLHVQGRPLIELSVAEFAGPVGGFAATHFLTATTAARHMISQGSGVILMLTAPPGRVAVPRTGAFASACALIESFARTLAADVGHRASESSVCDRRGRPRRLPSAMYFPRTPRPTARHWSSFRRIWRGARRFAA